MFKVWNPDDGSEDDAECYADVVSSGEPDLMAAYFARDRDEQCGDGYTEKQTILVRCPNGDLKKYIVTGKIVPRVVYDAVMEQP